MDGSPEPTVIARTLKDFNQFIFSGKKSGDSSVGRDSRQKLNFSEAFSDSSSIFEDDSRTSVGRSRKRQIDEMTGLDISKRFREKDSQIIDAKTTINRLEGRIHNMELSAKKAKAEMEEELERFKRKQLRDKELIDDLQHKIKQMQAKEREIQGTAHKVKEEYTATSWETESKMINMQREHIEQCNRLQEEITSLRQKALYLERVMEEKTSQVDLAQSYVQDLEKQLAVAQHKLRDSGASQFETEALKLQLDQAKSKIKKLEMHQEELESLQSKSEVFETTVRKLPALEKEIAKLKEENKFLRKTNFATERQQ